MEHAHFGFRLVNNGSYSFTINLEIFVVKIFSESMAAMKINLTKIIAHY